MDTFDATPDATPPTPHVRVGTLGRSSAAGRMILAAALAMAGASLPGFTPSGASVRNDPDRPKTEEDVTRLNAAAEKRARKRKRRAGKG